MPHSQALVLILVGGLLATIPACRNQTGRSNDDVKQLVPSRPSPIPSHYAGPGESVIDCIKKIQFLEPSETSGLLKAWKRQPNYQDYRMVEAPDFRIPEWVRHERYWPDVERGTGWSYDYGELSGAYGLVLFVINRKATFPNWFSVAVLIKRPGDRFALHWIFQNADLSHFNLRRHSGNAYLIEYTDDGKTRSCDLQYSRKLRRWACELYT